ncbi:RHS repeat domain-containing protein, partial [Sphingomonas sp. NCPPB 2930]
LNPPQVRHFHCDHLGTPIAMTQATGERTGQLVWAARYDAWGKVENEYNPNSIEQPIRFQGQQYDKETGLHYNRFRYYEESSGSYINQDPAGLAGGINKYKYARNIPNGLSDAYGLNPAAGAILGAEAGTLVLPGPGTVIGAVVGTLVGLAALMLASNVLQSSNQQASDRQKEYENYKRVCNESPPPGLDKCAEAAWKLKRNKSCRNLRKDWDDKWQPGRHDADIENLDRGINNLEEWISKNCHGT